jgi:VWFA-related protein
MYLRYLVSPATVVLTTALLVAPFSAQQQPQQQSQTGEGQPVFRAEVNYVEVDVRVTDSRGSFVRQLSRGDFEVLEDGKPQEITAFALVDVPYESRPALSPSLTTRIEPDVRTNAGTAEGRVFIILLDDLHTHALRSVRVKDAAKEFIQRYVGPNDLVSILHTSGRTDASQDFTTSRSLLLASVDKFLGRKLQSSTLARLEEYNRRRGDSMETRADLRMQRVMDPYDMERGRHAENLLETLERLANVLADTRGRRKAVVWVGEGIDYEVQNAVMQTDSGLTTFMSSHAESVMYRLRSALSAMTRSNVAVYGVDPRGIVTSGDDLIEVGSFPENPLLELTPGAFQREVERAQDSLRVISDETGGFAVVNKNDLDESFDRIMRDNSTYYLIGYYSNNKRLDGRFRKIEVRVKRPDVEVRARRGYTAPSSRDERGKPAMTAANEPSTALRTVLGSPLPATGVTLKGFAAAFKGTGTKASVLFGLEVDAQRFAFQQADGLYTDKMEAAVIAMNEKGEFLDGDRHTMELRLRPQTHQAVLANGVRLLFRLENLPPGRYQIRAAAHEGGADVVGSVYYDVVVPNFAEEALSMSGVLLASSSSAAVPTPRPDPELSEWLRQPPTASREFAAGETLTAAFALYGSPKKRSGNVDVTATLVDESGQVRFTHEIEAAESELREAPNGLAYTVGIPLSELEPGAYVLRVESVSRLTDVRALVREVPFKVRTAQAAAR